MRLPAKSSPSDMCSSEIFKLARYGSALRAFGSGLLRPKKNTAAITSARKVTPIAKETQNGLPLPSSFFGAENASLFDERLFSASPILRFYYSQCCNSLRVHHNMFPKSFGKLFTQCFITLQAPSQLPQQ